MKRQRRRIVRVILYRLVMKKLLRLSSSNLNRLLPNSVLCVRYLIYLHGFLILSQNYHVRNVFHEICNFK